ncbi:MAG: hypothetical protein AAF125_02845 [Chloroflexota bacterium]
MALRWNLATDVEGAASTQVFSGGACNIRTADGSLIRNVERDAINDWLYENGIQLFDPQIHPDTHDTEYDYEIHGPMEQAARRAANINLYEISPSTFGGVSAMEIAVDRFRYLEPTVLYYSDGVAGREMVPSYSRQGHPLFAPQGIQDGVEAQQAHYREMVKGANNCRKYLLGFADEIDTLTASIGGAVRRGDVVVTPGRIHAVDMFKAVARAASGERVYVHFQLPEGDGPRDKRGVPLFQVPEDPHEVDMAMLLDQYVDEGNRLRRALSRLIEVNVFVRVVYTQTSAIQSLKEVLQLRGLIPSD